jgi:ribosome-associated protein
MVQVTPEIAIDESEIEETFIRSPGPGGQNVNKVSTAVQLRFDAAGSPNLPEEVQRRLSRIAGKRMTSQGVLVIESHRHRSREMNRQDALDRLVELIRKASLPPKTRRPTRPTRASQARRLESKRHRGQVKRWRRMPADTE